MIKRCTNLRLLYFTYLHKEPVPLISKDSLVEQMGEEEKLDNGCWNSGGGSGQFIHTFTD